MSALQHSRCGQELCKPLSKICRLLSRPLQDKEVVAGAALIGMAAQSSCAAALIGTAWQSRRGAGRILPQARDRDRVRLAGMSWHADTMASPLGRPT